MIAITGNTYPVKEQIKALGGRWNADQKAWMVPDDRADEARRLVGSAPRKALSPARAKSVQTPTKTRTKSMQTRQDGKLVWVSVRQVYERGVGWVDARDYEED